MNTSEIFGLAGGVSHMFEDNEGKNMPAVQFSLQKTTKGRERNLPLAAARNCSMTR